MRERILSTVAIAGLVAGASLAAPTAANANGYYGAYGHGYYGGGGYYGRGFRGNRGYRGHYRGGGGGKGAAIALGIIGGAIILNEIAEDRARDRYYEARRYERYRRSSRDYDDRYDRGYAAGYERARQEQDGENGPGTTGSADLERSLDGGPEPIRLDYAGAYDTCLQHAREALGNRGFVLSAPFKPATAEQAGSAWKMTATVNAQRGSEEWSRAMTCEAQPGRVLRLELI